MSLPPSLEALSIGVAVADRQGRIRYANAAARSLLAALAREPQGGTQQWLNEHFSELCRRVLTEQRTLIEREVAAPDGLLDVTLSPHTDTTDAVMIELLPVAWHVRAQAERQAESQQAAFRQMLRGLAHELKNPLGGLRGAAQLLGRKLGETELADYCQVIVAETDRLAALVDRFAVEPTEHPHTPINLHTALERVYQLTSSREVTVDRDYDPSIPLLPGDCDGLIQALLNLVNNAIEADAGRIVLRSRVRRRGPESGTDPAPWAVIEVEDDGRGIPSRLHHLILYPLVTGKSSGSGLGLSVVQAVIARHRGHLEFHSRPGRTVFSLYLPLDGADD